MSQIHLDLHSYKARVIGTDHPFDTGPDDPVGSIDAILGLTGQERESVYSLTARSLLGEGWHSRNRRRKDEA